MVLSSGKPGDGEFGSWTAKKKKNSKEDEAQSKGYLDTMMQGYINIIEIIEKREGKVRNHSWKEYWMKSSFNWRMKQTSGTKFRKHRNSKTRET